MEQFSDETIERLTRHFDLIYVKKDDCSVKMDLKEQELKSINSKLDSMTGWQKIQTAFMGIFTAVVTAAVIKLLLG